MLTSQSTLVTSEDSFDIKPTDNDYLLNHVYHAMHRGIAGHRVHESRPPTQPQPVT